VIPMPKMAPQMKSAFNRFLAERDWNFEALVRGHYKPANDETPFSVEDVQGYLITQLPSLFATAFMHEPDTGAPYEFWDYQLPSVDYIAGDVIHEDGAEVGKTREIISLLLWSAFTSHGGKLKRPHSLIAAPLQTHLNEIIDAIVEQVENNPDLKAITQKGWHRKAPHHRMEFTTGAIIDFRPAGVDGNAFRGVHANAFVVFDEATKVKNKLIWSEFWRARKPAATSRIYSVPDGDRSCDFFTQCQFAIPYDEFIKRYPNGYYTGKHEPPVVKFHWAKTMMPAPFWSESRRRKFIDMYNGEDSSGYVRNVLGLWGDPASSVFPWSTFGPCMIDIPEYRRLKVMVDSHSGTVALELMRFEAMQDGNRMTGREVVIWDRHIPIAEWDTEETCRSSIEQIVFTAFPDMPSGEYGMGCDLGQTKDPTELLLFRKVGDNKRMTIRTHLRGVEYKHQCEFIRAMDILADPEAKLPAIGCDPGNAGTAVMGILGGSRFEGRNFESRLSGYGFGNAYDAVDLQGNPIEDQKTGKSLRQNGKELSTDLIVMAMQSRKRFYPLDPELALYYPSHTYAQGPRYRKFCTNNDHIIDADRQEMMNSVLGDGGRFDAFSCGAEQRHG